MITTKPNISTLAVLIIELFKYEFIVFKVPWCFKNLIILLPETEIKIPCSVIKNPSNTPAIFIDKSMSLSKFLMLTLFNKIKGIKIAKARIEVSAGIYFSIFIYKNLVANCICQSF